jgi:hypothetical protein
MHTIFSDTVFPGAASASAIWSGSGRMGRATGSLRYRSFFLDPPSRRRRDFAAT